MRKNILLVLISFVCAGKLFAQTPDSSYILDLNQRIDKYVVNRNFAALDTCYADDFVFTHGTTRVDNKAGWLNTVRNATYPKREHDSTIVEVHPGIAIVRGKMNIQRVDNQGTRTYSLKYIRAYAMRKNHWQMISHFTFWEIDVQ